MKNDTKSFSDMMNNIANEHNAQLAAEVEAGRRARLFAKLRKVVLLFIAVSLVGAAYLKRDELKRRFAPATASAASSASSEPAASVPDAPVTLEGARANFGPNLKKIREISAERAQTLDGLSQK
jgi:hypothetical protein